MLEESLHLLVVDDDEDDYVLIRHLLLAALPQTGLVIDHALSPEQAMRAVDEAAYDLFVIDYRLGGNTGLDLMRALRNCGIETPAIVLTGVGAEEIAVEAMKAGAADYLPKSKLNEASLRLAVRYAINLRKKEDLLRQARRTVQLSEERFRALVENSSEITLLLDAQGSITYASHSVNRVLGYAPEELVGFRFIDFVHPDCLPAVDELLAGCLAAAGIQAAAEFRFRRSDGTWCCCLEVVALNRLLDPAVSAIVLNARDMTLRYEAERALRATTEELEALFRASPLPIAVIDCAGRLVRQNPAGERVFRCRNEDVLGRLLPPVASGSAKFDTVFHRVLAGECLTGLEVTVPAADGQPLDLSLSMAPVLDAAGQVTAVVSIAADMTERKRMEEALRQSEREYRTLFENANDAILIFDPEGEIILEANGRACAIYGFSRDALIGRSLKSLTLDVPRGEAQLAMLLQDGVSRDFETVHINRNAEPIHMLVNSSVVEYRGRQAVLSVNRDITARIRAEEAVLRLSRQNELLLNSAGEGIIGLDAAGCLTFINVAAAKLLGYDPAEMMGQAAHELWHYARADGTPYPASECPMYRAFRDGQVQHTSNEFFWRKDGTCFPVECVSTPVREHDRAVGAVVVFKDITERRSLEQQLLQSQKMEAIGKLAGGVAHDFNNLLMVMSSYAELLLNNLTEARQRRHAEEILKAAKRAAGLTGQLLAFSRKQVMAPQILDLNVVIREIGKMLPRLIGEDVLLSIVLGPDLGTVKADPIQIEQVVMNLAVNSRDAMPHGGKLVLETQNVELDHNYARAHAIQPGRYVMLAVSDTGSGIDPSVLAHIFEPFFTTKERGKGTGLGLSTVYGIVRQSGGHIFVYSEVGRGTTFKIYLPQVTEVAQARPPVAGPEADLRGSEIILLVEDEIAVRAAAREFLAGLGYLVLQAANGAEAVAVARAFDGAIDLLLTDVVMPEMNGPDLAQRLALERSRMKVLYMSGYTESTILQHGVAELGTMFIQKPFTLRGLAEKIREVLATKALTATA